MKNQNIFLHEILFYARISGGICIKSKYITCIIVAIAVLAVDFSGCVEKQSTETTKSTVETQKSVELPSKYILLNRSAELRSHVGEYNKPAPSKTFLVINMTLENHGYKTFDINPNYIAVVIDKVAYPYDSATFATASPLTPVALLDGGMASGYLVFQIPDGETRYNLMYVGQGDYDFIYGELPTPKAVQESKPNVPSRNVTFSLDGEPYTFYGGDYYTRVDTSNPGYVTQITRHERTVSEGDRARFTEINIKTILDESLKPANKDNAIQEAIDSYIASLNELSSGAKIDENPAYEAALANGDMVTVKQFKKVPSVYNGQVRLVSYMPDGNTIVTVASSESKQEFDELIKTLNIGEMKQI